jgi:hypothetical protein
MTKPMLTRLRAGATQGPMRWGLLFAPALFGPGACVQVSAPDKPIEINLNINIRQEVVVRLQQDAKDLIKKDPGVF